MVNLTMVAENLKVALKEREQNGLEDIHPVVKRAIDSERRMSSSSGDTGGEKTPEIPAACSKLLANYPLIPRAELEVKEQLGAGTYGSVYKGVWCSSSGQNLIVALKKVFMLEKEVDILSQIRHRNIIQFFGVSHANPDFYIVTEYAENGSLFEHLHNESANLSSERMLKWAIQIAHGVAYLHYEAPVTIIHRDLKSKNVVIGHKMTCKLCDFGTSKDLTHSQTAPSWGGTAAWMSPEIISQKEGITTATDVWSFAVLLWEMFTREIPYKGLTEFKIYSIISQQGVKLVIPSEVPPHLANLWKDCWHTNPKERIDMKEVVSCLEHMKSDKEVQKQCAHFVEKKDEWKEKIQQQLQELDEMKLDLARKMEELNQREQALRKRESSNFNFWQMIDMLPGLNNIQEWDETFVCQWVQQIALEASGDINPEIVEKILNAIILYEIKGSRLLQITETDLERLGIDSPNVRRYIVSKIDELRMRSVDFINFPSLEMSAMIEARNKQDKSKSPFNYSIILHVGMYSRLINANGKESFRFKVFMDSDWEEPRPTDSVPPEIHDSATVIKDVCISMVAADKKTVLLETVRCICPPFGYLEWINAETKSLPVSLTLAVTYTDQIIQPRNTRINVQIDELAQPKTLCSKTVSLKIRPVATDTSISRIASSVFSGVDKIPSVNNMQLQGAWRSRRRSFGVNCSISPERISKTSLTSRPNKTSWSNIAAAIRKPSIPIQLPHHSKSIDQGALSAVSRLSPNNLPQRSSSYMPKLPRSPGQSPPVVNSISPSPLSLQSHNNSSRQDSFQKQKFMLQPMEQIRRRWRTKSETDSESWQFSGPQRANFFVEPDSPCSLATLESTSKLEQMDDPYFPKQNPSNVESSTESDESEDMPNHFSKSATIKEPTHRCCATNSCRTRIKPLQQEGEENKQNGIENGHLLEKRLKRKKSKKQVTVTRLKNVQEDVATNGSTDRLPTDRPEKILIEPPETKCVAKGCSQQVYGGYNKWKWKC